MRSPSGLAEAEDILTLERLMRQEIGGVHVILYLVQNLSQCLCSNSSHMLPTTAYSTSSLNNLCTAALPAVLTFTQIFKGAYTMTYQGILHEVHAVGSFSEIQLP